MAPINYYCIGLLWVMHHCKKNHLNVLVTQVGGKLSGMPSEKKNIVRKTLHCSVKVYTCIKEKCSCKVTQMNTEVLCYTPGLQTVLSISVYVYMILINLLYCIQYLSITVLTGLKNTIHIKYIQSTEIFQSFRQSTGHWNSLEQHAFFK